MFTWLNKQGVKSDEGYILQRMHRFYYHYVEGEHCMQVNVEPGPHIETVYLDSLKCWLPPFDKEPIALERLKEIQHRISAALTFMGTEHRFQEG